MAYVVCRDEADETKSCKIGGRRGQSIDWIRALEPALNNEQRREMSSVRTE